MAWGANLRKLRLLRELRIRTNSPLVPRPGDIRCEEGLLTSWFSKRSHEEERSKIAGVALWYSSEKRGGEVFAEWRVDNEEWGRISSMLSPKG